MTVEEFFAAVRRLGLKRTNTPGIWATSRGEFQNVEEKPERYTPEQRAEFIENLKQAMGIFPEEDKRLERAFDSIKSAL